MQTEENAHPGETRRGLVPSCHVSFRMIMDSEWHTARNDPYPDNSILMDRIMYIVMVLEKKKWQRISTHLIMLVYECRVSALKHQDSTHLCSHKMFLKMQALHRRQYHFISSSAVIQSTCVPVSHRLTYNGKTTRRIYNEGQSFGICNGIHYWP